MLEQKVWVRGCEAPAADSGSGLAPLSVIVVNYYCESALDACLHSLWGAREVAETIVVDNGSDERLRKSVQEQHPWARWIEAGSNIGFGRACNLGAEAARGGALLFLNPDTQAESGMVEALLSRLGDADGGSLILGCQVLNVDGSRQLSCRQFPSWRAAFANRYSLLTRIWPSNPWSLAYLRPIAAEDGEHRVDWVSGAAMAMRKSTFRLLAGFSDDYFMYMEDVDICKRASNLGLTVKYYPVAQVRHCIGGSSRKTPVRALGYRHRSIWTYYKKYLRVRAADPLVAAFLAVRWGSTSIGAVLRPLFHRLRKAADSLAGRTS